MLSNCPWTIIHIRNHPIHFLTKHVNNMYTLSSLHINPSLLWEHWFKSAWCDPYWSSVCWIYKLDGHVLYFLDFFSSVLWCRFFRRQSGIHSWSKISVVDSNMVGIQRTLDTHQGDFDKRGVTELTSLMGFWCVAQNRNSQWNWHAN